MCLKIVPFKPRSAFKLNAMSISRVFSPYTCIYICINRECYSIPQKDPPFQRFGASSFAKIPFSLPLLSFAFTRVSLYSIESRTNVEFRVVCS